MEKTCVLGGGCFWCLEAIFQNLKGVHKIAPGYAGGKAETATYQQVKSGSTEHAEVIQITYDEKIISLEKLLDIFLQIHDPTTLNRQGNDIGKQYRSVFFYQNEDELKVFQNVKKEVERAKVWTEEILTERTFLEKFYSAEEEHFNYFQDNQNSPYCSFVIAPKVQKVLKKYPQLCKN